MLVLSRKVGETLTIGDEVTVTILGIRGSQIRFGIDAPREVPVHREEIYHKLAAQKKIDAQCEVAEIDPATGTGG